MDFITTNLVAFAAVLIAVMGFIWKAAEWKGRKDAESKNFTQFIEEVRDDIKKILWALNPETRPIEKKSPLRLTDYGRKMAQEMNADAVLPLYIDRLIEATKGKTVYGIQEECLRYARHDLMEDLRAKNKQQADSSKSMPFKKGSIFMKC